MLDTLRNFKKNDDSVSNSSGSSRRSFLLMKDPLTLILGACFGLFFCWLLNREKRVQDEIDATACNDCWEEAERRKIDNTGDIEQIYAEVRDEADMLEYVPWHSSSRGAIMSATIKDEDIDISEIPELDENFFANATLTRPGENLINSVRYGNFGKKERDARTGELGGED
jgi:hypothetical protein